MIPRRRKWQPTRVFLPAESHGQRSLRAAVHEVEKSRTQLSDWPTHTHTPTQASNAEPCPLLVHTSPVGGERLYFAGQNIILESVRSLCDQHESLCDVEYTYRNVSLNFFHCVSQNSCLSCLQEFWKLQYQLHVTKLPRAPGTSLVQEAVERVHGEGRYRFFSHKA